MERCKGEDLFNATSACAHLKKVCNQDRLWKLICKREFGLNADQVRKPHHDNICWKCYYQERKVLESKDALKWHSLSESDGRREPKPRYAHSATAANGQIFFIGGEIRSESRYNDVHVFDPATMTFSKALNHVIPQPLSRHQSCAVGNKIYVFGGFDGVSRFNEMSVFNVAMNWWYKVETRGDVPAPRSNHACAVVGTNIYLFGGNNTSPEGRYRVLDDFYSFDTMTLTWKCLTAHKARDFPSSRSGHALVPFGNKLLLFGGGVWDDGSAQWVHKYNHVYLYDTEHGDWQRAETRGDVSVCTFPSTARLGHYHLLVFGGQSTKNNWTTNELFVLDTGT
jgi:N-acetylneuraminic acid mutarotase